MRFELPRTVVCCTRTSVRYCTVLLTTLVESLCYYTGRRAFIGNFDQAFFFSRSSGKLLASAVLFSHTNSSRLTSSCPTVQYCCKFALGEAKLVYYCKADQSQCEESLLESRTISLPRMLHKALTPYSVQYEVLKSKLLRPLWTPYNECLPPDESNLVHFV